MGYLLIGSLILIALGLSPALRNLVLGTPNHIAKKMSETKEGYEMGWDQVKASAQDALANAKGIQAQSKAICVNLEKKIARSQKELDDANSIIQMAIKDIEQNGKLTKLTDEQLELAKKQLAVKKAEVKAYNEELVSAQQDYEKDCKDVRICEDELRKIETEAEISVIKHNIDLDRKQMNEKREAIGKRNHNEELKKQLRRNLDKSDAESKGTSDVIEKDGSRILKDATAIASSNSELSDIDMALMKAKQSYEEKNS